jgi:maleylacetoacetate isomerase
MTAAQPTLYHYWRSSCSWRVRWALALKGLSFQLQSIHLLEGEQRSPGYLKKNPAGFVPALELTDGEVFGESLAILEWLEETHPTPALLPRTPRERLYVRNLAYIISSGTQPLQNLAVQKRISAQPEQQAEHARFWIARGLHSFEQVLMQHNLYGTYCLGAQVTLADLCLVPQIYNARRFNVNLTPFPLLTHIAERCLQTTACQQAAPEAYQPV